MLRLLLQSGDYKIETLLQQFAVRIGQFDAVFLCAVYTRDPKKTFSLLTFKFAFDERANDGKLRGLDILGKKQLAIYARANG